MTDLITNSWGAAANSGRSVEEFLSRPQLQVLQHMVATWDPERIEEVTLSLPQSGCPVVHTFSRGVYVRELSVPGGGIFLVGHEHKYEQLNIFLRGKVLMFAPDGAVRELSAPMMFTGGPGKKTGIVLEDMIWFNVYPAEETNLDTLEDMFLKKSKFWKNSPQYNTEDKRDHGYKELLEELGMTKEQMDHEAEDEKTQTDRMPYGSYKCGVHRSPIHGRGIMATADIHKGECIGAARIKGIKTPFGRYCNHSTSFANASPQKINQDILLFAKQEIPGSFGGALGDEVLIDYREMQELLK